MRQIGQFSLAKHDGPYEEWPLQTRLSFNDVDTGTSVPGFCIEAQYQVEGMYLLVTSWDCMFEEANDFTLLNGSFTPVAHTQLGSMYDSFLLESHTPLASNVLRLTYDAETRYDLLIERPSTFCASKPRWSLRRTRLNNPRLVLRRVTE